MHIGRISKQRRLSQKLKAEKLVKENLSWKKKAEGEFIKKCREYRRSEK